MGGGGGGEYRVKLPKGEGVGGWDLFTFTGLMESEKMPCAHSNVFFLTLHFLHHF